MKLSLFLAVVVISASSAFAADYKIDPAHSTAGFKVKHLAISTVPGNFSEISGRYSFDPANIALSKVEAAIATKTVDTRNQKRDDHLRSIDFLDIAKYPTMTFVSKKVTDKGEGKFSLAGDLTLHGVTKPVVLEVEHTGTAKDPLGIERSAFTATTRINRKDFGLVWNKFLETGALVVGENVDITLDIEGVKEAK